MGAFGWCIGPISTVHVPGVSFLIAAVLLAGSWMVAYLFARAPAAPLAAADTA